MLDGKDLQSATSLHHYFALTHNVWEPWKFTDAEGVDITEVWRDTLNQAIVTEHCRRDKNLAPKPADDSSGHAKRECLLTVAWIETQAKHRINIKEATFEEILQTSNLELAMRSLPSANSTIDHLDGQDGGSYVFSCYPKVALTWSRTVDGTIQAVCIAERAKLDVLKELVSCHFIQELLPHTLTPTFLCAVLFTREIDQRLEDVKKLVREVESRTGHHEFDNRIELPARGNLFTLAAKMSGCGTKLASHVRKIGILEELNRFITARAGTEGCPKDSNAVVDELLANIQTIERRVALQKTDAEYVRCRVQTQRDALFHLIAENDAAISHEMAKDSKTLAIASRRDSASMKSLALVSMLFLPGTFVSSLFGMPLFDWGPETPSSEALKATTWGPRLLVFASVTAPLMLVTFGAWAWWISVQHGKRERQFVQAERLLRDKLEDEIPQPEVRTLAMKQVNSGLSDDDFGASSQH